MNRAIRPGTLLAILTGLNLFNYFDRFILASVLENIKADFALSDAQAGSLSTAFMLGYFVTCPFFGYLGDRMNRKGLIAAGILVWSAATFLSGFATNYWQLIVCRVLVGLGEASYATLSPSLISDVYPPGKRNNALTIFYVAIPLGAAFGTLFGSWIGSTQSWHYAFIYAGAPGLLLAFSLLPFREPRRGEAEGQADAVAALGKPSVRDIFSMLKIPDYALVVWGYVAYTFAMGAYQHWGQAFLMRIHGLSQSLSGNFFGGVMVVGGLFGTFLGGFASTLWQKKNPAGYAYVLGLSVLAAVPLTYFVTALGDPSHVMAAMASAMLFLFLSTGPVNTVILESVPPNLRASAMAMAIFLIHAFGDLWSPLIVGELSDRWGHLGRGLSILPWALLLSALLWMGLALRRTRELRATNALP
jgi:MFS family permease